MGRSRERTPPLPPVVLITGGKDSGKTALTSGLISLLSRSGRNVIALKRAGSVQRPDEPGTDSDRFALSGAVATGLTWAGGTYVALFDAGSSCVSRNPRAVHREGREGSLEAMVAFVARALPATGETIVLAEGFSETAYPRVHVLPLAGETFRPAGGPVLGTWTRPADWAGTGKRAHRFAPSEAEDLPGVARIAADIQTNWGKLGRWALETVAYAGGSPYRPGTVDCVAAVLAGGTGSRLGGRDKWRLIVGGYPVSQWTLNGLGELFGEVIVVGRERSPGEPTHMPGRLRVAYIPDRAAGGGPLGGLLTAVAEASPRRVFVLAGDMPFVNRAFVRHMLWMAYDAEEMDAVVPSWGGHVEPLHAIYTPRCLPNLRDITTPAIGPVAARPRLTAVFTGLRRREVPESEIRLFGPPPALFRNLNTPADLALAEAEVSRRAPPVTADHPAPPPFFDSK